jgi:hypothetical protein
MESKAQGVKEKMGKYPHTADGEDQTLMWSVLKRSKTFYENLPWMPEGTACRCIIMGKNKEI